MNSDTPTSPEPSLQTTPSIKTVVLPLQELGRPPGQWKLTLYPTHLALAESPGAQPYILLRNAMMRSAVLMIGMRTFAITAPLKLTFKLSVEQTDALAEWMGNGFIAAHYLKQRYAFVLPIAVIWILGSLPLLEKSSPDALPFDPVGFTLGSILIVMWAFAKWRSHPVLFLVDSFWFLALAGNLVWDVLNGRSKGWLILVVLLLWMVVTGVRHFRRFRETKIVPQRKI